MIPIYYRENMIETDKIGGPVDWIYEENKINNPNYNWIPNYKSDDKTYWGPHYWFVFHTYSENYSENPSPLEQEVAANFIKSIPFLLPCAECKTEALYYIQSMNHLIDQIVKSKVDFINFFRRFHDHVNKKNNKAIYYPNLI